MENSCEKSSVLEVVKRINDIINDINNKRVITTQSLMQAVSSEVKDEIYKVESLIAGKLSRIESRLAQQADELNELKSQSLLYEELINLFRKYMGATINEQSLLARVSCLEETISLLTTKNN